MRAVMVDLETLGLDVDSIIISIGAVAFNTHADSFLPERKFYRIIKAQGQDRLVDLDTVHFHITGSPEMLITLAQSCDPKDTNTVILQEALEDFSAFYQQAEATEIWAKPTTFDISMLKHAYGQFSGELEIPWGHRDVRDLSTLAFLFADYKKGTAHNAIEDAVQQAEHCWQLMQKFSQLQGAVCLK